MKPLAIWLAVVAVVFGGYALITSATRDTTQVFVVVDSSFQMRCAAANVRVRYKERAIVIGAQHTDAVGDVDVHRIRGCGRINDGRRSNNRHRTGITN